MNPVKRQEIKLETRHKVMLGATGAAVALVLMARFLYLPVMATVGARRATLTDLRVKTADAHVLAGELADQEQALAQARARHRAHQRRIGHDQSVGRILESLGQLAQAHRLTLVAIQEREEKLEELEALEPIALGPELTLAGVPLTVQLKGRYRELGAFLGELIDAPFVSTVQELTIARTAKVGTTLEANLVLAVYLAEEDTDD